jgi:hypothetical protein
MARIQASPRYHKRNHATTREYEREIPQQMSTKVKQQIEWRSQGKELLSKGESNQPEIARILQSYPYERIKK